MLLILLMTIYFSGGQPKVLSNFSYALNRVKPAGFDDMVIWWVDDQNSYVGPLSEGLSGQIKSAKRPEDVEGRGDFFVLGSLSQEMREEWIEFGRINRVPVFSIYYPGSRKGLTGWSGQGEKRFQVYLVQEKLTEFGFKPRLPKITTIHIVDWSMEDGEPQCLTPNHEDCFPW